MFDNSREHDLAHSTAQIPSHTSAPATRRTFLAGTAAGTGATLMGLPAAAHAAGPPGPGQDWPDGPGRANRPQAPDAELRAILRAVDRRRIEANVRRLAAFGTRHTLSSQDDPERGIGAARDWIYDTMAEYAAASGGRMTVEKQSYLQEPDGERIPTPTDHQRPRDPARQRGAGPGLRDLGPLRLPGQRRHELHRRRARRRRRRVGSGGLDGAGAGVRDPPAEGHPGVRRGGRRGAGTLRLRPHGAGLPGQRGRRPGHVHQRHRRQLDRRRRLPRPAQPAALRRGCADRRRRGRGERTPVGRRRERLTGPPARPVRDGGRGQQGQPTCACG